MSAATSSNATAFICPPTTCSASASPRNNSAKAASPQRYRDLIRFQVERTEKLFDEGDALLPLLDPAYRRQIALFSKGGRAICAAVRRQNFDTLTSRPHLSKWQKTRLIASTLAGSLLNSLAWKRKANPLNSLAWKRKADPGKPDGAAP